MLVSAVGPHPHPLRIFVLKILMFSYFVCLGCDEDSVRNAVDKFEIVIPSRLENVSFLSISPVHGYSIEFSLVVALNKLVKVNSDCFENPRL
jgi:hypothetical protein